MLEFIIQGRGGQGAQTAGNILAQLYYEEGRQVLAYATYGGARRGAPVSSLLRVDDKPIRMRCDIENPDVIVCFDPSLLAGGNLLKLAREKTLMLINTSFPAETFRHLGNCRIATIDAKSVAAGNRLGRIVNTVLVGAALGAMGYKNIGLLKKVIAEASPVKPEENIAACMDGYRTASEGLFETPLTVRQEAG